MIGALVAFWRDEALAFLAFSGAALLARPTAAVIILFAGLATLAFEPARRVRTLRLLVATFVVWVAVYLGYERWFVARTALDLGTYSAGSIVDRFHFLTLTDWRRLVWVAVPAGILPFVSLFRFRTQDVVARSAAVATLLSFAVVGIPAFVGLHHFVPMMLLPIAVFWRLLLHNGSGRGRVLGAYALVSLISFGLALPPRFDINRDFRELGRRTLDRTGRFGGEDYTRHRAALMVAQAGAGTLFTPDWDVPDASVDLVGGAQFVYYARQSEPGERTDDTLVLIQSSTEPAPSGAVRVAEAANSTVFVLDSLAWDAVRTAPREVEFLSPLYRVPRATLRQYVGEPAGNYDTSLSNWPVVWKLFQR
jgi:hypothetical protein